MILTHISLNGVGKFGRETRIAGLGSGVNILAAGNEAGKSTLFSAVRACIFERHGAKNAHIAALASDGLGLPVTVEVEFLHKENRYRVSKSFLKSASASLSRDGIEIARGKEADERVWDLLGIVPGEGRSVDQAAFGLLWVGQGKSFEPPQASDAAADLLGSAIQHEVGALVGGERARSVMADLTEILAGLVTRTGQPKAGGPLARALAGLESSRQELSAAETRLSDLDAQFAELATKRRERARMADPAVSAKLEADLGEARSALEAGRKAVSQVGDAERAEKHARVVLDGERRIMDELNARAARIDQDGRRVSELAQKLAELEAARSAAQAAVDRIRAQIGEMQAGAAEHEHAQTLWRRVAEAAVRQSQFAVLQPRLAQLEALAERQLAIEAGLGNNGVVASVLREFEEIERELSITTARLEASATQIAIRLGPGGVGAVRVNGAVVAADTQQAVVDPLTIGIAEIATLTVTPSPSAGAEERSREAGLRQKLARHLESAGAETGAELRARRAARLELENAQSVLRAELRALGIPETGLLAEITRTRTAIETIRLHAEEVLAEAGLQAMPQPDEIAAREETLKRARLEARERRDELDRQLETRRVALTGLSASKGELAGSLSEIQNRLATDRLLLPDSERAVVLASAEARFAEAQLEYRRAAAVLEERRSAAPAPDLLSNLANRVSRLESALENQRNEVVALDRVIAGLEGQILVGGGDGLGERVQALREEADLWSREVEGHREHVASLQLLRDTVEACYREQQDRLNAPLRRHLQPFLSDVFPGAELELADGYAVAGLKRSGPGAETFDRLSHGTREQIAVLVRLAMGSMIGERDIDVPIVLDDALVFSDDERIEQMFDALNRAGQRQQVIVLTCRTRTFAALGGRRLSLEAA